ncbi:MAG TPA: FHA domain-containing protein [Planctomicrobium sp.]|nr:FHA domain-containing protein [Planctomicrobium sp.]
MKMALVPVDGGEPILLDKAILLLGRGAECDVVVASSRKVSRKHCCVARIEDRFVIRDLASMNGVRINDSQVKEQAVLLENDFLWVGDVGYQMVPYPRMQQVRKSFQKAIAADIRSSARLPGGKAIADSVELVSAAPPPERVIPEEEILELDDSDILE